MRLDIEGGELQELCGSLIAAELVAGLTIFLQGDLGAGKTTLVRGILRGLGHEGKVKSPTYTLVESYSPDGHSVHHLDLYRLADPEELDYLGIGDLCDGESILLIEWPDRGIGMLPPVDIQISITHTGMSRGLSIEGASRAGKRVVAALATIGWPEGITNKA